MTLNEKFPEMVELHDTFERLGLKHEFCPKTPVIEDNCVIFLEDKKGRILIRQNSSDKRLQVWDFNPEHEHKYISLNEIYKLLTD